MSELRANPLGVGAPGEQDVPADLQGPMKGQGQGGIGGTPFHQAHNYDRAVYEKLVKSRNLLDHIRVELDRLREKGDTISPEDVIGAAGRIVGHGVPAREMAALLTDMPQGAGQGLAQWVAVHDQAVTQQEMEVDRVRGIAQHRVGVSALRALAATHVQHEAQKQVKAPATPPAGNALAPGGIPTTQVMQMQEAPGAAEEG